MAGRYCEGKIKMASEKVSPKMVLEIKYFIANYAVMHLSAAIPGGLTPGTYGGTARGLLTFVPNFWPGTGPLDCGTCNIAAILKMKDPDRGEWVHSPV